MIQSTEHQGRNQAHTYLCHGPTEATGAVAVIPSSTNTPLGNALVPSSVALTTVPSFHTKHTKRLRVVPTHYTLLLQVSWCYVLFTTCVCLSPCINCWHTDDVPATCVYFFGEWNQTRCDKRQVARVHVRVAVWDVHFCCLAACCLLLSSFDVNAQR